MLKRLWALITRRHPRQPIEPDLSQMHAAIHNDRAQRGGPDA